MSFEMILDKRLIDKAIDKFGDKYSVTAREVLFDQHRLFTKGMMAGTPPKTMAIGRVSVKKDLEKIFVPINRQDVLDWYAENFGKKPKGVGKKVRKHTRSLESQGVFFNWNGNKARMKGFHDRFRTGPQKGVRFKSRKVTVSKDLEFGTGMYVPASKLKSYTRDTQKSVGKLKAGWVPAALKYGVKVSGWIMRHTERRGGWEDRSTKMGGELSSINRVPWAKKKIGRLKDFESKKRQLDMKKHMERAVERIAKKVSA